MHVAGLEHSGVWFNALPQVVTSLQIHPKVRRNCKKPKRCVSVSVSKAEVRDSPATGEDDLGLFCRGGACAVIDLTKV